MPRIRRWLGWILATTVVLALLGAIAAGGLYYAISSKLPDVQSLKQVELQEPMYVYSSDGRLMAVYGETRRYPIQMKDVPLRLKQAFLATEDARFYEHGGVDYKGIARAVWLLTTTDAKRVPGGSTITQQVARQFFLSSEYSYTRKLAEILLARKIESELSKDEIFELYLNKSFFGNRAYGVGAAAEYYYGKKMSELSLDEMASLAGIPKFPSSGNPISNPERAQERRDYYVLQRMADLGFVSQAEADAAKAVPMHCAQQGLPRHHDHRCDPADRCGCGGRRRLAGLRSSPWLARRRAALRRGRRCGRARTGQAPGRRIHPGRTACGDRGAHQSRWRGHGRAERQDRTDPARHCQPLDRQDPGQAADPRRPDPHPHRREEIKT